MSSSQPAPKDKPKLGDSLPQNAINPHSLGGGCTNLLLHLHEGLKAGGGSQWDQEKGLVGQNPPFSTPNLLWGGLLCSLPIAVTREHTMRGINPK